MRDVPVLPALALVLAVLVVATAAAGLAPSGGAQDAESSDSGIGIGEGEGSGAGEGDTAGFTPPESEFEDDQTPSLLWTIAAALVGLLFVGSVLTLLAVLWREGLAGLVELLRSLLASAAGAVFILVFALALFWFFAEFFGDGGGGSFGLGGFSDVTESHGGSSSVAPVLDPPMALLAVGALVLAAVLALVSTESLPTPGRSSDSADVSPGGRTDHDGSLPFDGSITGVEPTNPVYRSWLALAEAVEGTSRRTSTPGEVASAAIADGFDPDAVRTVTDLFAEVRYGDRPVDEERAERARAAREVIDDQKRSS